MSLENNLEDICPHLDERIEEYKKTKSPLKKYSIEQDLRILFASNKKLYDKYNLLYQSSK